MCDGTKNLTKGTGGQVSRHVEPIQFDPIGFVSRRPSQIASPILITTVYRRSSKAFPDSTGRSTVLRPTCIMLLSILGKYDRNRCRSRHPAIDKLRHGPGLRPSACRKQIDWPSATRLRDEIFYVLVARGGVTRTTQGK